MNKDFDPLYFEKYITHKDIKNYFNNNPDKTEMKLWVSFLGNVTISGRNSQYIEQRIRTSQEVIIKKKSLLIDSFGDMGDLFDELDKDSSLFGGRHKKKKTEGWTLYPQDTITHFDWIVEVKVFDGSELVGDILENIKFFPDKDRADMNFLKMMDHYLIQTGLLEALAAYKVIDKRLGEIYPEEFI